VTDGDDRVNAKDGLDDMGTAIAAPAIPARTPVVIRRGIIVSSRCPAIGSFARFAGPDLKRTKPTFVLLFDQRIVKNLTRFRRWTRPGHELNRAKLDREPRETSQRSAWFR
jgi:hypothetical protein